MISIDIYPRNLCASARSILDVFSTTLYKNLHPIFSALFTVTKKLLHIQRGMSQTASKTSTNELTASAPEFIPTYDDTNRSWKGSTPLPTFNKTLFESIQMKDIREPKTFILMNAH